MGNGYFEYFKVKRINYSDIDNDKHIKTLTFAVKIWAGISYRSSKTIDFLCQHTAYEMFDCYSLRF